MNGIKQMGNMTLSVESFCSSSIPLIDPLLDPRSGPHATERESCSDPEFSKSGDTALTPHEYKEYPNKYPNR